MIAEQYILINTHLGDFHPIGERSCQLSGKIILKLSLDQQKEKLYTLTNTRL